MALGAGITMTTGGAGGTATVTGGAMITGEDATCVGGGRTFTDES